MSGILALMMLAAGEGLQFPGGPVAAGLGGIVIGTFIGMFIRRKR